MTLKNNQHYSIKTITLRAKVFAVNFSEFVNFDRYRQNYLENFPVKVHLRKSIPARKAL